MTAIAPERQGSAVFQDLRTYDVVSLRTSSAALQRKYGRDAPAPGDQLARRSRSDTEIATCCCITIIRKKTPVIRGELGLNRTSY